jgi:hypothetical protein
MLFLVGRGLWDWLPAGKPFPLLTFGAGRGQTGLGCGLAEKIYGLPLSVLRRGRLSLTTGDAETNVTFFLISGYVHAENKLVGMDTLVLGSRGVPQVC